MTGVGLLNDDGRPWSAEATFVSSVKGMGDFSRVRKLQTAHSLSMSTDELIPLVTLRGNDVSKSMTGRPNPSGSTTE